MTLYGFQKVPDNACIFASLALALYVDWVVKRLDLFLENLLKRLKKTGITLDFLIYSLYIKVLIEVVKRWICFLKS